jgi:hypothetical protein
LCKEYANELEAAALPVFRRVGVPDHLVAAYPDAEHAFPRATRLQA